MGQGADNFYDVREDISKGVTHGTILTQVNEPKKDKTPDPGQYDSANLKFAKVQHQRSYSIGKVGQNKNIRSDIVPNGELGFLNIFQIK